MNPLTLNLQLRAIPRPSIDPHPPFENIQSNQKIAKIDTCKITDRFWQSPY